MVLVVRRVTLLSKCERKKMVRMAWGWAFRNEGEKEKNSPVRGIGWKWWIRRCFGVRSLEDELLGGEECEEGEIFLNSRDLAKDNRKGGGPRLSGWKEPTEVLGRKRLFSSLSSALVRGRSRRLVCDWGINNGENPLCFLSDPLLHGRTARRSFSISIRFDISCESEKQIVWSLKSL